MRKGKRKTSRCLYFCKQNLKSRDSWEGDWAPQARPWSLWLFGQAASVQSDKLILSIKENNTHVSLTIFLSALFFNQNFYHHCHPTILQHTFSSLSWQTVQTNTGNRQSLDLQCLLFRPPEILKEHI